MSAKRIARNADRRVRNHLAMDPLSERKRNSTIGILFNTLTGRAVNSRSRLAGLGGLGIACALAGCATTVTHPIPISQTIEPAHVTSNSLAMKTAVVIPDELNRYRPEVLPSTGGEHAFAFEIGRALGKTLFRSAKSVYGNSTLLEAMPRPGAYGAVLVFSLEERKVELSFEQDERFGRSGRAYAAMAVMMEVYDGLSLTPLKKTKVNGKGFLIRPVSAPAAPDAQRVYASAVESCIQQLADKVAALLADGFGDLTSPRTSSPTLPGAPPT